jgi:hypothetical protein
MGEEEGSFTNAIPDRIISTDEYREMKALIYTTTSCLRICIKARCGGALVVPCTQEAEAGRLLEPNLGSMARSHLRKKKKSFIHSSISKSDPPHPR